MKNIKMVILVNMRLKMKCGKIASQCCHASNNAIHRMKFKDRNIFNIWNNTGQKTIIVKANDEEHFLEIKEKLDKKNIQNTIIKDMGLTQIEPGSITTMAVGPYFENEIDEIIGDLKLL